MSLFSFEQLEILTGFRDIQYIFEKSCREAIGSHPYFCGHVEDSKSKKMTDQRFQKLHEGGNVIATFKIDAKICGNFELAGAWSSKDEPFLYINIFGIVENFPFKMQQIHRYEVKVEKRSPKKNTSTKIHVRKVSIKTPTKSGKMGYKSKLVLSAVCLYGLYHFKDDIMNHDAFYELHYSAECAISKVMDYFPFSCFSRY